VYSLIQQTCLELFVHTVFAAPELRRTQSSAQGSQSREDLQPEACTVLWKTGSQGPLAKACSGASQVLRGAGSPKS
jgi:hypothetical protein